MDYMKYMKRIEAKMGETKAPDGIQEEIWFDQVMSKLDNISKDFAKEFQAERNGI
jgi:hypothetical protein